MNKQVSITKASGRQDPFSEEKLRNSLQRAGAGANDIDRVIEEITPQLYEGITTKKIYKMAFKFLKESSRHMAARYHLKRAIMELGPSGYPFEKFVGEILKIQGYATSIGEIVQGRCVTHEIDVIAKKGSKKILVECKYHNMPGTFSDVKVPLYIHARFKDVESEWQKNDPLLTYEGMVATNTKFSSDAIQYGNCAGLRLIGWDYPAKGSLRNLVDELALYPVTCLTSLQKGEKQQLLDKKIVLAKEIDEKKLLSIGIKQARLGVIMQETHQLCRNVNQHNTKQHELAS